MDDVWNASFTDGDAVDNPPETAALDPAHAPARTRMQAVAEWWRGDSPARGADRFFAITFAVALGFCAGVIAMAASH